MVEKSELKWFLLENLSLKLSIPSFSEKLYVTLKLGDIMVTEDSISLSDLQREPYDE